MKVPIGFFCLMTWLAPVGAWAVDPESDIPDPSVIDDAIVVPVGSSNELFIGAAVDAKVRGIMKRLGDTAVTSSPNTVTVSGGSGRGAPNVEVGSVDAPSSARTINNFTFVNGLSVQVK